MAEINILSEIDKSYIAGIIDGEGSILLKPNSNGYRSPTVSITSSDPELIRWIHSSIGCGTIALKPARKITHRDNYHIAIASNNAISLLNEILPYLKIERKIKRAKHIVENYKNVTPRNGFYTSESRKIKENFETEFYVL